MATPDKLKLTAYKTVGGKESLSTDPNDSYVSLVNPETYTINYKVNLNIKEVPGTSGSDPSYANTPPPTMQFDFLFDGSGVLPKPSTLGALSSIPIVGAVASAVSGLISPQEDYDVMKEITKFNKVVFTYDGDQHSPRKIQLLWGKLIFDGNLTSLNFNFKLFKPDGTPLRAVATAVFVGSVTDKLRVAAQKDNSPDLTHVRQVTEGDTLPLMTYKIYGDASYYMEVARVNNLTNFRNLKVGDSIKFPPINK
ncbi:MAG: hypothetical protein ABI472_21475 [Ginsengibacter sp.]